MSLVSIIIMITLRMIVYLSILNDRQIDRALSFYPALGNLGFCRKEPYPTFMLGHPWMVEDDVI